MFNSSDIFDSSDLFSVWDNLIHNIYITSSKSLASKRKGAAEDTIAEHQRRLNIIDEYYENDSQTTFAALSTLKQLGVDPCEKWWIHNVDKDIVSAALNAWDKKFIINALARRTIQLEFENETLRQIVSGTLDQK